MATRFGMTDFINPTEVGRDKVVQAMVDVTNGGADYTFDCTGNTEVMRQALESAATAAGGPASSSASPRAGTEISTRPFQLITGRTWKGTAFGGARGRTDVPTIVDWYMDGKIEIDPLITHTMPLDEINTALRSDACGREHPFGRDLLTFRNRIVRLSFSAAHGRSLPGGDQDHGKRPVAVAGRHSDPDHHPALHLRVPLESARASSGALPEEAR